MQAIRSGSMDFELPERLQAALPTEVRGIARDEVRLLVSQKDGETAIHTHFKFLDRHLRAGDVLAVNTSGTLMAALQVRRHDGTPLLLHLSTQNPEKKWIVELRRRKGTSTRRFGGAKAREILQLEQGGQVTLQERFFDGNNHPEHLQLWVADFELPLPLDTYLDLYGAPVRYLNIRDVYPSRYYQTVFANEKGSAEMPSAGRPFTPELITRLIARGVQFAPLLLHTGVASLEANEHPYPEYYRMPPASADLLTRARRQGRRIIAVGTTAVRAIETVTDQRGTTRPGEGWTHTVITPARGLFGVDGLITGFHEPRASHLLILEALAGRRHLARSYHLAMEFGYQWHEFGDAHLILP
jgi:S-adenosylmethionine:tRNA ribosyltransferase-isomerase